MSQLMTHESVMGNVADDLWSMTWHCHDVFMIILLPFEKKNISIDIKLESSLIWLLTYHPLSDKRTNLLSFVSSFTFLTLNLHMQASDLYTHASSCLNVRVNYASNSKHYLCPFLSLIMHKLLGLVLTLITTLKWIDINVCMNCTCMPNDNSLGRKRRGYFNPQFLFYI